MSEPTTTQSTPLIDQDSSLPKEDPNDAHGGEGWDSNDDGVNEEWDLQSPLLMTPSRRLIERNPLQQSGLNRGVVPPVEDGNILDDGQVELERQSPTDTILFVAAGSMILLFIGCVSGSFFFAWW